MSINIPDHQKLTSDSNNPVTPFLINKTIHQFFEEQVEKTPDDIAVIYDGRELTYRELNEKANQLAYTIRNKYTLLWDEEVKGDALIGIYLERGFEMVIGILGILKSGAAYVPFDNADPEERLRYKINNCGCRMVITSSESLKEFLFLADSDTLVLSIDSYKYEIEKASKQNPDHISKPTDLAYVIYTSGSTGNPKGAMIEHHTVLNLVRQQQKIYTSGLKVMHIISFVFDVSVEVLFSALLNGCRLYIVPEKHRKNFDYIQNFIYEQRIDAITLPAALIATADYKKFEYLKYLVVGGETPDKKILELISNKTKVIIEYGLTETTVTSTMLFYKQGYKISIGKPIVNTEAYILDSNMKPVSIGEPGELFLGGDGLARGYLNRLDLTKERFVDNPFVSEEDKVLGRNLIIYKTGDICRYLADGNIEFIGRNDNQIKIRGYRVEPGEVEASICSVPGIRQCAVICYEREGNKYLVCYYVSEKELSYDNFVDILSEQLPDYMIPSVFVYMQELPLNTSGKVDRKVLPEPKFKCNENNYEAPSTDVERKLCEIWEDVLEIEKIGVNDEFLRLGGNSILAIRLNNKINNTLDINLSVTDIFKHKTIRAILQNNNPIETRAVIAKTDFSEYPLSFAQERLFFIEEYEGGTNAYNLPVVLELCESIDIVKLKESILFMVERHEALRTVIGENNGRNIQVVLDSKVNIAELNVKGGQLESQIKELINLPFKIKDEHPVRIWILNGKVLIINFHHIAFDGWSVNIFLKEFNEVYQSLVEDRAAELSMQEINYRDFTVWQKKYLQGDVFESQKLFWINKLSGYDNLNLPLDQKRPSKFSYVGDNFRFDLSKEIAEKAKETAKNKGVTLNSFLLSCFNILLSKYSGQNDIVVGVPVANRHYREIENIIGFFVNSLAIRANIVHDNSVKILLHELDNTMIEAQQYQDIPFEKIVELLGVEKDLSRNPVFQVMFGVQSFGHCNDSPYFKSYKTPITELLKISQFDLTLFIDDGTENMECLFEYSAHLFNRSTIEQMSRHFKSIVAQVVENTEIEIKNIQLLSSAEYKKIILDWNCTEMQYPENKTLHRLFEEQVDDIPDSVAVVFNGKKLTYRELNEKANQLAHTIRDKYKLLWDEDVKSDTLIGIYIERGIDMIVGILGILKAGAAYVPFDNADPEDRLKFKINDCGCKMVLTSSMNMNKLLFLSEIDTLVLSIDAYKFELNKAAKVNPKTLTDSNKSLAYVIYTSGSTGKPKGVMIEHKSAVNLIFAISYIYNENIQNCTFFTSYNFDVSVSEIFCTLTKGKTLHVLSENLKKSPEDLGHYINENKINLVYLPPVILSVLPKFEYNSLHSILYAGELGPREACFYWSSKKQVYNLYGPTETTIYSIGKEILESEVEQIGKPLHNYKAYILDNYQNPVPVGVSGELYISGKGLARGYLNRDDLTKERFIPNHFVTAEDKLQKQNLLLYKTGDVCRYLSDGNIEFLGRNDNQIKIRGFRVELGEIESKLTSYENIDQSVVLCKTRGADDKYLVAFYVAKNEIASDILHNYLSGLLPDYMIPAVFIYLKEFPLNVSGKVDRKALPEPDLKRDEKDYTAPSTDIEEKLCEIWQDILSVNKVGVDSGFFNIGGNSIKLMQLQAKIRDVIGISISITDLFNYYTISQQAEYLSKINQPPVEEQNILSSKKELFFEDIAIIGISAAYSNKQSINELWDTIQGGEEAVEFLDNNEILKMGVSDDTLKDGNYINCGARFHNVENFEPSFFNLSPRDAVVMDPQVRHFTEHAWRALEDSGNTKNRKNKRIGVFAGAGLDLYLNKILMNSSDILSSVDEWELLYNASNVTISTKSSFFLDLHGPSIYVNTLCSTSLVSIIQACNNLVLGSCDIAIAGGATIRLPSNYGYKYKEGIIFSKDGHCRVFDESASGTIPGDGVGVIVLKRLSDAMKANDNIYGVIKGYGINNDGQRKVGFTAPSIEGQVECIKQALRNAEVLPDDIGYIECHGTGTKLGDPIELQALTRAYHAETVENDTQKVERKCYLGSIKANIGHTDTAAGIAGLIKICMMFKNGLIPPQINYNKLNPLIDFDNVSFDITKEPLEWDSGSSPRIAGLSSFGLGGTNAHMILQEPPMKKLSSNHKRKRKLLCFSAKSKTSLDVLTEKLHQTFKNNDKINIADAAYTLQVGRESHPLKRLIVCDDVVDAISSIEERKPSKFLSSKRKTCNKKIGFLCSGQGTQYINMGLALYKNEEVFKEVVERCSLILEDKLEYSLLDIIYPPSDQKEQFSNFLNNTRYTQLGLFVIEYAISELWRSWGVEPSMLIGHSLGEYVAGCISGVFSLEDALKVVEARGRLMSEMNEGFMVSLMAPYDEVSDIIEEYGLSLAAINDENSCVISGENEKVERLKVELNKLGTVYKILNTSHAFHSYMMKPMLDNFKKIFDSIDLKVPAIPFISNSTGTWISNSEAQSPDYWVQNILKPVYFSRGVKELVSNENYILIEIGPGNVLSNLAQRHPARSSELSVISSLPGFSNSTDSSDYMIEALGKLWLNGYDVDFSCYYGAEKRERLPQFLLYEFSNRKYWAAADISRSRDAGAKLAYSSDIDDSSEEHHIEELESFKDGYYPRPELMNEYEEPKSHIEKMLAQIWQDVLGIQKVGVTDDFYELGGNSLIATQIAVRCKKEGIVYKISQFYENPNIKSLSDYVQIEGNLVETQNNEKTEKTLTEEILNISPLQNRYFERGLSNVSAIVCEHIKEIDSEITFEKIKNAVRVVKQKHLNLSIQFTEYESTKKIKFNAHNNNILKLSNYSFNHANYKEEVAQVIYNDRQSLNIFDGPVYFISYFECPKSKFLYFLAPHINSDSISLELVVNEIISICKSGVENISFEPDYDNYKAWLNKFTLKQEEELRLSQYWNTQLLRQKLDGNRPVVNHSQMKNYFKPLLNFEQQKNLKNKLKTNMNIPFVIPAIYAFMRAFCSIMNKKLFVANFVSHGRSTSDFSIDCTDAFGQFAMHTPLIVDEHILEDKPNSALRKIGNLYNELNENQFSYNQCAWGDNRYIDLKKSIQKNIPSMLLNYHETENINSGSEENNIDEIFDIIEKKCDSLKDSQSAYYENINFWASKEEFSISFYYSSIHYDDSTIKEILDQTQKELEKLCED